ncbi:hypothetical protein [Pseudonocardia sp. N23]|uniref:hypothetical protein n=1 Tax=Pseudonocardia sp. N23 TaxID=1987376 RepID=UPI000BFD88FE|nr:hypothetical protein [Pseudonocardia sp. N23]GAY09829.1 hypothetical protein TOK_4184 [Pseudonocardia sp. N23]
MSIPAHARVDRNGRELPAAALAVRAQHYEHWMSQARRLINARSNHHLVDGLILSSSAATGRPLPTGAMQAHAARFRDGEQRFGRLWAEVDRRSHGRLKRATDEAERRELARHHDRPSIQATRLAAIRSLTADGRRGDQRAARKAGQLAVLSFVDDCIVDAVARTVATSLRRHLSHPTNHRARTR